MTYELVDIVTGNTIESYETMAWGFLQYSMHHRRNPDVALILFDDKGEAVLQVAP